MVWLRASLATLGCASLFGCSSLAVLQDGKADGGGTGKIVLVRALIGPSSSSSDAPQSWPIMENAGDLLVASVYCYDCDPTMGPATVSDSNGNAWESTPAANGMFYGQLWYASNIKGGANTVTVVGPASVHLGAFLLEYQGVAADHPLDGYTSNIATQASTESDTGTFLTLSNGDAVVALFVDVPMGETIEPGAGFTVEKTDPGFIATVADNTPYTAPAGSQNVKATLSAADNGWIATVAAFRPQ